MQIDFIVEIDFLVDTCFNFFISCNLFHPNVMSIRCQCQSVMSFSFKMAPTRSILGFLNPKTITAVISSNISRTPCRFIHKCSNYCDPYSRATAISGTILGRKNLKCKFYMLSLHHLSFIWYLMYYFLLVSIIKKWLIYRISIFIRFVRIIPNLF